MNSKIQTYNKSEKTYNKIKKENIKMLEDINELFNFLNDKSNKILSLFLKNNSFNFNEDDVNNIKEIVKEVKYKFNDVNNIIEIFKLYFNNDKWNSRYYYFTTNNKEKNIITVIVPEDKEKIQYCTLFKHSYGLSSIFERALHDYGFEELFKELKI